MEYSLRAIPLGGYTGFPDDSLGSPYPPNDPDLLCNRSITSRALVTCAGVLANVIFAYTVLVAQVHPQALKPQRPKLLATSVGVQLHSPPALSPRTLSWWPSRCRASLPLDVLQAFARARSPLMRMLFISPVVISESIARVGYMSAGADHAFGSSLGWWSLYGSWFRV